MVVPLVWGRAVPLQLLVPRVLFTCLAAGVTCLRGTAAPSHWLSRVASQLQHPVAQTALSHHQCSSMASTCSADDVYGSIRDASGNFKFYANGRWLESTSGKSVPVINPSTQEQEYAVQGGCQGGWGLALLMGASATAATPPLRSVGEPPC